ncbi:MAG: hypothetical protein D4Q79_01390 [Spirochaetia bacterium]|nr:MAG: hypothetical protein D4Q79_01390 [Spirochaetia bacterium]
MRFFPEFNSGRTFYFSGIKFFKFGFYFTQIFDIIKKALYLCRKNNIKSILLIVDAGPCMLASFFLFFLTKIPIDFYFFDLYKGNNSLSRIAFYVASFIEKFLIKKSRYLFFIWDDLKDFYKNRYPDDVQKMFVISSSIIYEKYYISKTDLSKKSIYRIYYTGSISKFQFDIIKLFCEVIRNHSDLELYLFTPHKKTEIKILNEKGIYAKNVYWDYAEGDKLIKELKKADLLLMPFSFLEENKIVVSIMVGGKIVEYLASAIPILLIAPSYAAVTKFFMNYNLGLVVSESSKMAVESILREFIKNEKKYLETALMAREVSKKFFTAEKNCQLLMNFLFN